MIVHMLRAEQHKPYCRHSKKMKETMLQVENVCLPKRASEEMSLSQLSVSSTIVWF